MLRNNEHQALSCERRNKVSPGREERVIYSAVEEGKGGGEWLTSAGHICCALGIIFHNRAFSEEGAGIPGGWIGAGGLPHACAVGRGVNPAWRRRIACSGCRVRSPVADWSGGRSHVFLPIASPRSSDRTGALLGQVPLEQASQRQSRFPKS